MGDPYKAIKGPRIFLHKATTNLYVQKYRDKTLNTKVSNFELFEKNAKHSILGLSVWEEGTHVDQKGQQMVKFRLNLGQFWPKRAFLKFQKQAKASFLDCRDCASSNKFRQI